MKEFPSVETMLVAGLRGFCAGVVRAIDVVERALEVCDGPVYVRKEIIHNRYVVDELRAKGAILVEEVEEIGHQDHYARRRLGVQEVKDFETVQEDVSFSLPVELKALLPARAGLA